VAMAPGVIPEGESIQASLLVNHKRNKPGSEPGLYEESRRNAFYLTVIRRERPPLVSSAQHRIGRDGRLNANSK
jgi:hypothetical protein